VTAESHFTRLIERAREGDPEAWKEVFAKYFPRWVARFHGELGDTLKRVWDTEDIVQSALAEAIAKIGNLRNEACFFAWVSAIVRRKLLEKQKLEGRLKLVRFDDLDGFAHPDGRPDRKLSSQEENRCLLDTILALFPVYPEHMGCVYLRYFAGKSPDDIALLYERSKRTVYRLLQSGLLLIRSRLSGKV